MGRDKQARGRWCQGSWGLSTQDVRRISDHEVREFEKPIHSDVARSGISRENWVQLGEGCRYETLKLLQIQDDDAVRRNFGSDLQVFGSREVMLAWAFGRWQSLFKQVAHSFKGRVQSSCVKKRQALELHCCKHLRANKRRKGSRGALSRGACERRGVSLH